MGLFGLMSWLVDGRVGVSWFGLVNWLVDGRVGVGWFGLVSWLVDRRRIALYKNDYHF